LKPKGNGQTLEVSSTLSANGVFWFGKKSIFDVRDEREGGPAMFQLWGKVSRPTSCLPIRTGIRSQSVWEDLPFPRPLEQICIHRDLYIKIIRCWKLLAEKEFENSPKLRASPFFLPHDFPKLYGKKLDPVALP